MLTDPMRKKIQEQSWSQIEEDDSNPTQTWRRLKDQSVEAINDLILLARKLPEDKQKEIFSPQIIDNFIRQILYLGERHPNSDSFNPRKAELAAMLVNRGIDVNSYQYLRLNEDTPSLVKTTVDQLEQCVSVCNDISYKLKLMSVEEEAEKTKYRYLFSWNNMIGREKRRLLKFITDRTGDDQIEIFHGSIKRSDKAISFRFGQSIDGEEMEFGTFGIEIYNSNTSAKVMISHEDLGLGIGGIWDLDLLVRETLSDFNMYMKKEDMKKK
jgi:hypothetical protein